MSATASGSLAMIGLGVMGANLARNIESRGYKVSVFDRSPEKNESFKKNFGSGNFYFASDSADLIKSMPGPRTIFTMVPAGAPVDAVIHDLIPLLAKGDTIIDGGNSFFKDTERREKFCLEHGINFLGIGVSGGEEGALHGPSIMPGGPKEGWARIQPVLEAIAAKVDGEPCTAYIGTGGAGHFVKMVHNGIEYGDMQLIAESYDLLKHLGGLQPEALASVYKTWNEGRLNSFLIDITASIFTKADDQGGSGYLVDKILDKAGQKGTGKWTSQTALDAGIAIPTLAAAVDSRCMSALKSERVAAEKKLLPLHDAPKDIDKQELTNLIEHALYSAKILAYAQGMRLIKECSDEFNWGINLSSLAALWRGGCIIRAKFLNEMRKAFQDTKLPNLILDPEMNKALQAGIPALRKVVALAVNSGIPVPALSSAIGYYDQYRRATLPLNLTQAQRDFFGAHTYERIDKPGVFHTQWS
jgi:6-phosphogluconate dehydrogenase